MTQAERMKKGLLYLPLDEEILKVQLDAQELLYDYNRTRPHETEKRRELLKKMFGEIGENCFIEPPLYANWGGKNCRFGSNIYANYGLTLVDDEEISVGDNTMIGPGVVISSAGHPVLPELREKGYQYNLPVRIGRNCWIGSGTIINPGVSVGDNTVIGAGSVVTKDIPANVVAVGAPCRVMREISERDREFYRPGRRIDWEEL